MSNIGILQGRLSVAHDGRFQFFPRDWREEFHVAAELGFSSIEWLFDWPDYSTNPIINTDMEELIEQTVKQTGVFVNSICADYFMKYRFLGEEGDASARMIMRLVKIASRLTKQKLILIPFLEQNALSTEKEKLEVVSYLTSALKVAQAEGVRIGLETEMPVPELNAFLDAFNSEAIGVYYDIGNCTSYGFNCAKDIVDLGKRIFGVHIKDRKKGSPQSVTLGTGSADIKSSLESLKKIDFQGVPIMQAWRGADYLNDARQQLHFLQKLSVRG